MEAVQNYIQANRQRFLDELLDFLRIPSISADTKYKDDVLRAANWLSAELKRIGMDGVEVFPTKSHQIHLIYGHHRHLSRSLKMIKSMRVVPVMTKARYICMLKHWKQ